WWHLGPQEALRQLATGAPALWLGRHTDIGQRGEAAATGDAHPGSAGLQISPGNQFRSVVPRRQRLGGAIVKFVTIGCDYQRHGVGRSPGENDQAHGYLVTQHEALSLKRNLALDNF